MQVRQVQVEEHQVHALPVDEFQGPSPGLHAAHCVALLPEDPLELVAQELLVVDD